MTQKEEPTLGQTYQSDQEETEDEEVKRNCIMGESGMRASDFSDSDSDMEEAENNSYINDEKDEMLDCRLKAGRIGDLVKFVTVGNPIVKPKGVVLYCPTPVMLSLASQAEKPEETGKTSRNESGMKCGLSKTSMNTNCRLSKKSKAASDIELSASGSSSSCSSDNDTGDNESAESDTDMKSTSLDFPFVEGEDLSMIVGVTIINSTPYIEEGCCESSLDDQQEAPETMTGGYALVGASGASVDDKWFTGNEKRVLSSNSLSALNQEADYNVGLRKRMRLCRQSSKDVCGIPEIALGIEALDQIIQPLPRQYLIRDDSLLVSSSSDDEDDQMLSEELEEKFRDNCASCIGANLPIPLLTPPKSPQTADETFEHQIITSVEWPSNLGMDSAIMKAFTNISEISTISNRDERLNNDSSQIQSFDESSKSRLAPRLRTISIETP